MPQQWPSWSAARATSCTTPRPWHYSCGCLHTSLQARHAPAKALCQTVPELRAGFWADPAAVLATRCTLTLDGAAACGFNPDLMLPLYPGAACARGNASLGAAPAAPDGQGGRVDAFRYSIPSDVPAVIAPGGSGAQRGGAAAACPHAAGMDDAAGPSGTVQDPVTSAGTTPGAQATPRGDRAVPNASAKRSLAQARTRLSRA